MGARIRRTAQRGHLRRGVHPDRRPRPGRGTRGRPRRRLDRHRAGRPHRAGTDLRSRRPAAASRHGEVQGCPPHLGHHRNPEGRQAFRRWARDPEGNPGPHTMARRGAGGGGRADVPCVGLLPARVRRVDGVHDHHPAQVRSGSHPGTGGHPSGHRIVRGAGDVRPHRRIARRDPKPLQRTHAAFRRGVGFPDAARCRHQIHGSVRRCHLQQLQRHRGRHDRHRDTG